MRTIIKMIARGVGLLAIAWSCTALAVEPDCWVKIHVNEDLGTVDSVDTINGPGEWSTLINLPGAALGFTISGSAEAPVFTR